MERLYLDHNATTPLAPAVRNAVLETLDAGWANASSVHHEGRQARAAVDTARESVSRLIGADPHELIFTGSGTESDVAALWGAAWTGEPSGRRRIIVAGLEHEAVLATARQLARRGWPVTELPCDASGLVDPDALRAAITDDTAVVSVMHANNEVGTIQPIAALAAIARAHGALFHTDAVQSAGKIPVDVSRLGVDLLSLAAHKIYGPKGAGALWVRRGVRVPAVMTGGRQEHGRRAGTENVPALVGFGVAAELARTSLATEPARLAALRDRLETGLLTAVPDTHRNGRAEARVPNTTNLSFDGAEAESVLIGLDLEGIAVSTGSACSSGRLEPSHVLKAMGLSHARATSSIRFSLGASTTDETIDRVLDAVPRVVARLRQLAGSHR